MSADGDAGPLDGDPTVGATDGDPTAGARPAPLVVRPAVAADAAAVWPLARDFATSFVVRREAFDAAWPRLADEPAALLLVARRGPRVVGYLLAHRHATFLANGPVAWVEEVMVADDERRTGVGRALMAAAERWAGDEGCAYVSLASRRAGPFYLALGYDDSAVFYRKTI